MPSKTIINIEKPPERGDISHLQNNEGVPIYTYTHKFENENLEKNRNYECELKTFKEVDVVDKFVSEEEADSKEDFEKKSKKCLSNNKQGRECNLFSMRNDPIDMLNLPFPLFSKLGSKHQYVSIRNCEDQMGQFQVFNDIIIDKLSAGIFNFEYSGHALQETTQFLALTRFYYEGKLILDKFNVNNNTVENDNFKVTKSKLKSRNVNLQSEDAYSRNKTVTNYTFKINYWSVL